MPNTVGQVIHCKGIIFIISQVLLGLVLYMSLNFYLFIFLLGLLLITFQFYGFLEFSNLFGFLPSFFLYEKESSCFWPEKSSQSVIFILGFFPALLVLSKYKCKFQAQI